ncbi:phosphatidate cytidylyltransferase [Zalerion maritima]|uniref:Phosphatidate cytidylyltransferase n=1 Tax=Zalerion maritima TaxID=339359 RepID=A0AAD5WQU2_9PEZI|nr:phosphatidate cytidylyltransferase [Zalerion maritima]
MPQDKTATETSPCHFRTTREGSVDGSAAGGTRHQFYRPPIHPHARSNRQGTSVDFSLAQYIWGSLLFNNKERTTPHVFVIWLSCQQHAVESNSAAINTFNLDPIAPVASFPDLELHKHHLHSALATANTRSSRKDKHLHSTLWPICFYPLTKILTGTILSPATSALPPFPYHNMSVKTRSSNKPGGVPSTPRVISPSPTPSDGTDIVGKDGSYSGPTTRSAARRRRQTPLPISEDSVDEDSDRNPEFRRSRTRSRSPIDPRKIKALTTTTPRKTQARKQKDLISNGTASNGHSVASNGHLAPPTGDTKKAESAGWSWRDLSRSPSPLGLIPIHRHWRTFVHKHEVPRKLLHVSIGFFSLWLYISGVQTNAVAPWLMLALLPITIADFLRFYSQSFNRLYVKALGALMRESEYNGYNGVIFYLLGAWIVLAFFPKDVGFMGILLLSWCDTAASTFGRLYGRYTPRIRKGKSFAGSFAAFAVGIATASWFWGWFAPTHGPYPGDEEFPFMFTGTLRLPEVVTTQLGLGESESSISGGLALGVMSVVSGFIAAASEVVDVFGWDDNLTIPVLSGIGIWGFLKVFG